MTTKRQSIHELAANVRRAIAGDLDAAERYDRLGRPEDAAASRASAARWESDLRRRLSGSARPA